MLLFDERIEINKMTTFGANAIWVACFCNNISMVNWICACDTKVDLDITGNIEEFSNWIKIQSRVSDLESISSSFSGNMKLFDLPLSEDIKELLTSYSNDDILTRKNLREKLNYSGIYFFSFSNSL